MRADGAVRTRRTGLCSDNVVSPLIPVQHCCYNTIGDICTVYSVHKIIVNCEYYHDEMTRKKSGNEKNT